MECAEQTMAMMSFRNNCGVGANNIFSCSALAFAN